MAYLIRPTPSSFIRRLPGLAAWWDFSDVGTYGPLVAGVPQTMRDKSGRGNGLTTHASNTGVITLNNTLTHKNAIDGTAGAVGYTSPLSITGGELTVYYSALMPSATISTTGRVISDGGTGNWLLGPYNSSGNAFWQMYTGGFANGFGITYPRDQWNVHTGVVSARLAIAFHHGNGVLIGNGGPVGYPGGVGIGISFGEFPTMKVGEIIIQQAYDEPTRIAVQDYLFRKWGAGSSLQTGSLIAPAGRRTFFAASAAASKVPYNPRPQMAPIMAQ